MPATIVGRANGRSIRALTARLPGNSSRTSTQAISVPTTRLTATTSRATAKVSRSAARAWGVVAACQNAAAPPREERHTTAASGSSTTRLRYIVTVPRSSAAPPQLPGRVAPAALLAANRHPDLLLDPGQDAAVLVEELLVHLAPAAQVGDPEQ